VVACEVILKTYRSWPDRPNGAFHRTKPDGFPRWDQWYKSVRFLVFQGLLSARRIWCRHRRGRYDPCSAQINIQNSVLKHHSINCIRFWVFPIFVLEKPIYSFKTYIPWGSISRISLFDVDFKNQMQISIHS